MPTIKQLPAASTVSATDELPLSQSGVTRSVQVSALLTGTQSAISLVKGRLLGRVSTTAGGPEPVSLGTGLMLQGGALMPTGDDHAAFAVASDLLAGDEVVINSANSPRRLPALKLRKLFSAGTGVQIDTAGVISTIGGGVGPAGPKGDAGVTGATGTQGPKGDTGTAGAVGPQGIKGDTGAIGLQGSRGDAGAIGPAGSQGAKGDSGAIGATGPLGLKGEPGVAGPQGNIGAQGPAGALGPQGLKGDTGAAGPTGLQGVKGDAGPQGPAGATGSQGLKGDTGSLGATGAVGLQGPKGDIGGTGVAGPPGAKGDTGPQGSTGAVGVQGPKGDAGATGLIGPQGAKGDAGPQGAKGDAGPQGAGGIVGPQGLKGDTGLIGAAGPQGAKGDIGTQGPIGATGLQGATGPQGAKGDTGTQGPAGASAPATASAIGSVKPGTGLSVAGDGTLTIADLSSGSVKSTGSVASRAANDRFAEVFNVLDFRAVVDSDWTNAFQRIFTAAPAVGGVLLVPAGNYSVVGGLTCSGKSITIQGPSSGAAIITQSGTGTCISITPSSVLQRVIIRNISFVPNASSECACALDIAYPAISTGPVQTTVIQNVEISSSQASGSDPYPQSYRKGIRLNGAWSTRIDNCHIFLANTANRTGTAGIELALCYNTVISGCGIVNGAYGILVSDYCEAIKAQHCSFACGTGIGYAASGTPKTVNSQASLSWYVTGCEFDCSICAISANRVSVGHISTNDIGIHTDAANLNAVRLTDCTHFVVSDNTISGAGPLATGVRLSQVLGQCNCNLVVDNAFVLLGFGVVFDAGTRFNVGRGNQLNYGSGLTNGFADNGGDGSNSMRWYGVDGSETSGAPHIWRGPDGSVSLIVANLVGAVNTLVAYPAASGNAVRLASAGPDTNVGIDIQTKGTGPLAHNGYDLISSDKVGQGLSWNDTTKVLTATGGAGVTGPAGPKGDTGTAGPQGIQGLKGDTGATGAQGSAGATGPQGLVGTTGLGIASAAINGLNHLILTRTDSSALDAGVLPNNTRTVAAGLTAAGTTQGTAYALTADESVVTTVASGSGVILRAVSGQRIMNRGANALQVYPPAGGSIEGGAINVAASLPSGATVVFVAFDNLNFFGG